MSDRDPAALRFAIMQFVRLAGMACAVAGAIVLSERWIAAPEIGAVLLVGGALAFFLIPLLLARRWRTPDR